MGSGYQQLLAFLHVCTECQRGRRALGPRHAGSGTRRGYRRPWPPHDESRLWCHSDQGRDRQCCWQCCWPAAAADLLHRSHGQDPRDFRWFAASVRRDRADAAATLFRVPHLGTDRGILGGHQIREGHEPGIWRLLASALQHLPLSGDLRGVSPSPGHLHALLRLHALLCIQVLDNAPGRVGGRERSPKSASSRLGAGSKRRCVELGGDAGHPCATLWN
mmetsp:Transcript_13969/g.52159  ORF Transcript_13969/g.52159 Transcript_13969/m.52159 type:complete len:219 (-) Transcript_13969:19-675(-)